MKIFYALCAVMIAGSSFGQTARLQVIHNSADAAADSVDVYLDGTLLLDNFAFRNATPFIDAPAGTPISVAVAPKTSSSVADAIATFPLTLTVGETYVAVADGIVSASGYSPATPFNLEIYATGREAAATTGNTDLLIHHGSTDAPVVDVYESGVLMTLASDDLAYADFDGYVELPTDNYIFEIQDAAGTTVVKSYDAPLSTLGLTDAAVTVVASGFFDPSVNSSGPGFGLWVALASGGELVPLSESSARVQVIHNSADAAADSVDVYLNGEILLDDFGFRNATPFIDAPAGVEISIAVAPKTSASVADAIATFPLTLAAKES
jgi:hypothetical protein